MSAHFWVLLIDVIAETPVTVKTARTTAGLSLVSASQQMIGVSAYKLREFEKGRDVSVSELRSILLWLAVTTSAVNDSHETRG